MGRFLSTWIGSFRRTQDEFWWQHLYNDLKGFLVKCVRGCFQNAVSNYADTILLCRHQLNACTALIACDIKSKCLIIYSELFKYPFKEANL